jgi:CheY-like chemotaxis protein
MRELLIVDDDTDGCSMLAAATRPWGYRCTCVANGREALRALTGGNWDAVIVDIGETPTGGLLLLQVMRSYLRWQTLPVIALTPLAAPDNARAARSLGVTEVFVKSRYTMDKLRAALDGLTGGRLPPEE